MQADRHYSSGPTRLPRWRLEPPFQFGVIYHCSTHDLVWPSPDHCKPECAITAVVAMDSIIPVNSSNSPYIWVAPVVIGPVAGQKGSPLKLSAGEGGILEHSFIVPELIQPIHRARIADRVGALSSDQRNRLLAALSWLFPAVARINPI